MKATITPETHAELMLIVKARDMYLALVGIDRLLHDREQHCDDEEAGVARMLLLDTLDEYGICLDDFENDAPLCELTEALPAW